MWISNVDIKFPHVYMATLCDSHINIVKKNQLRRLRTDINYSSRSVLECTAKTKFEFTIRHKFGELDFEMTILAWLDEHKNG